MQPEEFFVTQRAHGTLNFPTHATPLLHRSRFEGSMESKKMTTIDESAGADIQSRIGHVNSVLYLYGTPPLILFCVISIAINIKVLMSVFWIKRPLSPTLHISLSLAGADAFSSTALGIGLIINSFIPYGLGIELKGVGCFVLALEAVRLGGVIITVFHLMALAINHYLGILKPLHYLSIMTYRNTTFLLVLLWMLPISFFAMYFSLIENEGFRSVGCEKNLFLYHKQFRILFSSLFFGPFVLMVCIYVHIFCIVKKHQETRLRFRRAGSSFRPASEALRSTSRQMAKNVKAVHTTLFILGSFLIGWMPGVIMYMLVCKDCLLQFNWVSGHSTFFIYTIINCLIILKTLVNPIIYAARMHEIKAATRRMRHSFCEWVTAITGLPTNQGVNRVHNSEKSTRSRHSQASRHSTYRSSRNTSSRNTTVRSSRNATYRSSRNATCRSSRNATCRSSHNVSVRAQNGSTYTCTVCNVHECGNTLV